MRIDSLNRLQRCALAAQKVLLNLDALLTDDAAIVLTQQVIYLGNAAGRRIFDRQNSIIHAAICHAGDNLLKGVVVMTVIFFAVKIIAQRLMRKRALRAEAADLIFIIIGTLGQRRFLQNAGLVDNAAHNIFYGHRIILVFQKACHLINNLGLARLILYRQSLGLFIGCHLHHELQAVFQHLRELLVHAVYVLANSL